jgi:hypothetical protein
MSMGAFTVISAAPGFELLVVGKQCGTVRSIPIVGWSMRLLEDGFIDHMRPILCAFVPSGRSDEVQALKWPDGRVCQLSETEHLLHASVEEWLYAVRVRACGCWVEGTA